MSKQFGLPKEVFDKFQAAARSRCLEHYVGNRARLKPLSELVDDPYVPIVLIYGASLDDQWNKGRGNRLCRKLIKKGLLMEIHRRKKTMAVQFTLNNIDDSEKLIRDSHSYLQLLGYVTGLITERIE